jgi:hypothetical protein
MKNLIVFSVLVAAPFAVGASLCGIGDWGKRGVTVISSGCIDKVVTYECGGVLGNEPQWTGTVFELQVADCYIV